MTSARLKGKTALITGGATGIGRATAELFGAEGAQVEILDYNAPEGYAALEAIAKGGGQAAFHQTDVRSAQSVETVFQQLRQHRDRLDILVCSAGVLKGAYKGVAGLSEEDWDATIDTNLKGTYLVVRQAAPLLERAGQSVVLLLASGAGVRGASSSLAYAASKAGVHGMQYNIEAHVRGARVHVICPGGIATPLKLENVAQGAEASGQDPAKAVEGAKKQLGDPMGVARVLAFLASEEGSYVRGTIFTR
ncbi:MAG: SDR family oxidoreductase [Candidatus Latescibacteria bacterium]|nr:SDR family oxidoreductase [Candidatus Latescibacterota bacterium]